MLWDLVGRQGRGAWIEYYTVNRMLDLTMERSSRLVDLPAFRLMNSRMQTAVRCLNLLYKYDDEERIRKYHEENESKNKVETTSNGEEKESRMLARQKFMSEYRELLTQIEVERRHEMLLGYPFKKKREEEGKKDEAEEERDTRRRMRRARCC